MLASVLSGELAKAPLYCYVTAMLMLNFSFLDAFGVFVDFYTQTYETNYSATVISMIGSLQVFVLYTCKPAVLVASVQRSQAPSSVL